LICVDIVKYQVKFCLLLNFLHRFLTNLASTGGPHEISWQAASGRGLDSTALDFKSHEYQFILSLIHLENLFSATSRNLLRGTPRCLVPIQLYSLYVLNNCKSGW